MENCRLDDVLTSYYEVYCSILHIGAHLENA